jgi:hypothetical protein
MARLLELMQRCELEGIKLRFWPFDGLDICGPEYNDAHVVVEPFPSSLRPEDVTQTDANDAWHTARAIQLADLTGKGEDLFQLTGLSESDMAAVRFEGWIVGNLV